MSGDYRKYRKPPLFKLGVFTSAFVAFLLAYVFLWNVAKIPGSALKFSERGRALGELLGLDQSWTMYAPSPTHDDGWFVIPGKLKDGRSLMFTTRQACDLGKAVGDLGNVQELSLGKNLCTTFRRAKLTDRIIYSTSVEIGTAVIQAGRS